MQSLSSHASSSSHPTPNDPPPPRAPSTGLHKRSQSHHSLSAQTRSMSKIVAPTHPALVRLESLASKAQKTPLGGVRRKRPPLLDALMNAAGKEAEGEDSGVGRAMTASSQEEEEEQQERPRKLAKPSMPSPMKEKPVKRRMSIKPRQSLVPREGGPPITPRKMTDAFFGNIITPKADWSPKSDSSEDGMLLVPTPRKSAVKKREVGSEDELGWGESGVARKGGLFARFEREGRGEEDMDVDEELGEPSRKVEIAERVKERPNGSQETRPRTSLQPSTSRTHLPPPSSFKFGAPTTTSRLPQSTSTSSFALPTKSSLTKGSTSSGMSSSKQSSSNLAGMLEGPKRPAGVASGAGKVGQGEKKKLTVPTPFSFSTMSGGSGSSSAGGHRRTLTGTNMGSSRHLASVVERPKKVMGAVMEYEDEDAEEGDGDVEMEDVSALPAQRPGMTFGPSKARPTSGLTSTTSITKPIKPAQILPSGIPSLSKLPTVARRPTEMMGPQAGTTKLSTTPAAATGSLQRKPSYPAGLGSGPLANPTSRVVSNPVVRQVSNPVLEDGGRSAGEPSNGTTSRSVSAPVPAFGAGGISGSKSRREGLSATETSKSLYGLNAALAKLQVKKDLGASTTVRPTVAVATAKGSAGGWSFPAAAATSGTAAPAPPATPRSKWLAAALANRGTPTSEMKTEQEIVRPQGGGMRRSTGLGDFMDVGSLGHKPRHSIATSTTTGIPRHGLYASTTNREKSKAVEEGAAGSSTGMGTSLGVPGPAGTCLDLKALMESSYGKGALKGVVAFVDVRTSDGDDGGAVFEDILRKCGARTLQKPSESVTHIIFKGGRQATLQWYHKQDEEDRPFVVGIGWIMKCKELGQKVDEEGFKVDVGSEAIFQRRRKSMEPKQMAAMMAGHGAPSIAVTESAGPNWGNIAQARRKSMQFAPRIGSPLKKAYRPATPVQSDAEGGMEIDERY